MSNFIYKRLRNLRCVVSNSPTHKLHFLQHNPFSSSSPTPPPPPPPPLKSIPKTPNQHSFTVEYLIKSCGFSPENALSASKHMNLETPDRADSVKAFFSYHGFTQTQISSIIRKFPRVLFSDPKNTLLPKIQFLQSKGFSPQDIPKIVSTTPSILKRSLENQIIPAYNFCNEMLQSQEKTNMAVKRFGGLLLYTYVAPNIEVLREIGLPNANIVVLLTYQPRVFMIQTDRLKEIVEEVKNMGFNPERMKFVFAVKALAAMSKSTWEKKVEVYKKWGLSEDEILVAFGKHPSCMMVSEDKIMGVMDFFVNKMGFESSIVVRRPGIVTLSLERRIIPRCLIYQILLSNGLLKKDFSLHRILESPENAFIRTFVKRFEEEAPELLKLYQEKLNLPK